MKKQARKGAAGAEKKTTKRTRMDDLLQDQLGGVLTADEVS